MGLFGSKKDMPKIKASELFSEELFQKVNDEVGNKFKGGEYGIKYNDFAKSLIDFASDPNKEYTEKELRGVIYSAGCFTKIEPDLAPLLNEAISKYKELKKNKAIWFSR